MAVESKDVSASHFLLLHFCSSVGSRTALQCQRLHEEDEEEAQGDDQFSVGIVHLGTERGAVGRERTEVQWTEVGWQTGENGKCGARTLERGGDEAWRRHEQATRIPEGPRAQCLWG